MIFSHNFVVEHLIPKKLTTSICQLSEMSVPLVPLSLIPLSLFLFSLLDRVSDQQRSLQIQGALQDGVGSARDHGKELDDPLARVVSDHGPVLESSSRR
jgi:hypothetical protein